MTQSAHPTLFNLGFRIFFTAAGVFAVASIASWLFFLETPGSLTLAAISPFHWHAHEMLYGYALAVIAGFLLTAVKNWTQLQTPHGWPLAGIFGLWLLPRILWFAGDAFLFTSMILDILFIVCLSAAVARPVVQRKQWRQMAILAKLFLLGLGNLLFYLGALGILEHGIYLSLYGGLYLIIGLILTIGRRIVPFFVERGVPYPVKLFNARWLDISSMLVFLTFFIAELSSPQSDFASACALLMFAITSVRIIAWYTPGIWETPLLWGLFAGLAAIALGFLLTGLRLWLDLNPFLGLHAFAIGGIGTMTLSLMIRVSIGHTGRNLKALPGGTSLAIVCLVIATIIRALFPIFWGSAYGIWINIAGFLWLSAFTLFCLQLLPILGSPRVDQRYG